MVTFIHTLLEILMTLKDVILIDIDWKCGRKKFCLKLCVDLCLFIPTTYIQNGNISKLAVSFKSSKSRNNLKMQQAIN